MGLLTVLAFPAAAPAVSPADRSNAAKECKAERGEDDATREAFVANYGANKNGRNAFGRCVSQRAKEEKAERKAAKRKARRVCQSQEGKKNYEKCLARQARKEARKQDEADMEEIEERTTAAKDCDAERTAMGEEAFAARYGANKNARNAFGKCVSSKAKS